MEEREMNLKRIIDLKPISLILICIGLFSLTEITFAKGESDENEIKYKLGKEALEKEDHKKAISILKPLADKGHGESQFWVGLMYRHGLGTKRNSKESYEWFYKALTNLKPPAEKGDSDSQLLLGLIYNTGFGLKERNYPEALKWFNKAAEQGNAEAQNNLGSKYRHGQGVKQDIAKANFWYQKSANQGNAYAKEVLKTLK